MKKVFILIFLLFCPILLVSLNAENVKSQSQQLFELKEMIKRKEQEKNKLVLQERVFKKELKTINHNMNQTEQKLEKYTLDIKMAQRNINNSSKIYNNSFLKSFTWNRVILDEIGFFNKMTFIFSYEHNPLEYKIRRKSLEYKKENFEKTKKIAMFSALNIEKWKNSKREFLNLQQYETNLMSQYKKILAEKNKLLKITSDKRLVAEQNIKSLGDTAKALQKLINKINISNKQNQINKVRLSSIPELKKKKSLPWPVSGKVILNFGKNRHPELDTYIISNGIKINAANFSLVKSIDSGVVVFVGQFRSYGKIVVIDHNNSIFSVYGLLCKVFVKEEQKILRGAVIAELGNCENSILYFEIRPNNVPDNPILWLQEEQK
jgi:murein DD-endopeptidase MepM/ murein hydrolase activator NlpD